ncbi:MAG: hypothetical protein KDD69_14850 [Bdellovibrionales bacterium]|nr:hypothetical protein [Bdellovibrionales bacterium]
MAGTDRFNILIIDPDSGSRGNLKQAALALTQFHKVYATATLKEAIGKTDAPESIDVLFISYRFDAEDIAAFIDQAKQTKRGKDWAYCAVLKASEQKNDVIAGSVIGGIDGFLFEPFSADNLREIAEVTAKVKLQNELKRKQAAMQVLLKEISAHLDAVAFYKKRGRDPRAAMRKLAEAASSLEKFKGNTFAAYVEAATEYFGNVPPPISEYTGASQRVRARMEERMLRELEDQYQ